MDIEKIGNINKIFRLGKINKLKKSKEENQNYRVDLSPAAKQQAEVAKFKEIIENTPDIRVDKVNEVKRKIQTGNYFSNFSKELLATKLMESAFIPKK